MNTSTLKKKLLLLLICLAPVLPGQAAVKAFVRGSAWRTDYVESELNAGTSRGLAAGVFLGAGEHHEISLETVKNTWDWDRTFTFGTATLGWAGEGKSKLLLAGYRYYFGKPSSLVRVFLGGSLGTAKIEGDLWFNGSGVDWKGSADKTRSAFGGTTGLSFQLFQHVACEAAYRYNVVRGFDATVKLFGTGPLTRTIDFPDTTARLYSISLRVTF